MRECVAPFHAGAVSSLGTVLSGVGRRVNKLGLGSGQGQGWLRTGNEHFQKYICQNTCMANLLYSMPKIEGKTK